MGEYQDLSDSDESKTVTTTSESIQHSRTAGWSMYEVVSNYQKRSKEGQEMKRRQGHGHARLTDVSGE